MPMPEATVNKYGNFLARQDNVGASGQFSAVFLLAITERADEPVYNPFGSCVSGLYPPHDIAALDGGEGVHVPRSLD